MSSIPQPNPTKCQAWLSDRQRQCLNKKKGNSDFCHILTHQHLPSITDILNQPSNRSLNSIRQQISQVQGDNIIPQRQDQGFNFNQMQDELSRVSSESISRAISQEYNTIDRIPREPRRQTNSRLRQQPTIPINFDLRPFIVYNGGKASSIDQLVQLLPTSIINGTFGCQGETYFEPFVGGGAMFLNIKPTKFVINDKNTTLINLYRSLLDNHIEVMQEFDFIAHIFSKCSNNPFIMEIVNSQLSSLDDNSIRKSLLYILSTHCTYRGRVERRGVNLEVGSFYKDLSNVFLSDERLNLESISRYFDICDTNIILNGDFVASLQYCQEGDFVFLDPPYISQTTHVFAYDNDDVDNEQTIMMRVKEEAERLTDLKVKIMITHVECNEVKALFSDTRRYNIQRIRCQRNNDLSLDLVIRNYPFSDENIPFPQNYDKLKHQKSKL